MWQKVEVNMKPTKIGRPKVDNPKSIKYSIRIDNETENRLVKYCEKKHITKGEAIRRGINLLIDTDK